MQAAAPLLIEQKRGGAVVLTSSAFGLTGRGGDGTGGSDGYVASKHGVVGLMRTFATWLAPHGIRVNCVNPSGVATRMVLNPAVEALFGGGSEPSAEPKPVDDVEPVRRAAGPGRRHHRGRGVPGLRRGPLHHRGRIAGRRRDAGPLWTTGPGAGKQAQPGPGAHDPPLSTSTAEDARFRMLAVVHAAVNALFSGLARKSFRGRQAACRGDGLGCRGCRRGGGGCFGAVQPRVCLSSRKVCSRSKRRRNACHQRSTRSGGAGDRGPQPHRFRVTVAGQMVDLQPDQGALDDRQLAVVVEPAAAVGQPGVDPVPAGRDRGAVAGGLGAGGVLRFGPGGRACPGRTPGRAGAGGPVVPGRRGGLGRRRTRSERSRPTSSTGRSASTNASRVMS